MLRLMGALLINHLALYESLSGHRHARIPLAKEQTWYLYGSMRGRLRSRKKLNLVWQ
jgi:hypothetical protein